IDEYAAANGPTRRRIANDEPVARSSSDRALQNELHESRVSRRYGLILEQNYAAGNFGRGVVHVDREPLRDWLRFRRQDAESGIDTGRWRVQDGIENDISAMHRFLADLRPAEDERTPLTRFAALDRLVLCMNRTHPGLESRGADKHAIVDLHAA